MKAKKYIARNYAGWLLVSPCVLGILLFAVYPMLSSLYYSFFEYDVINPAVWNSFKNFTKPFQSDWEAFSKSVVVTVSYCLLNIPLTMALSFALAVFLNQKVKGIEAFRVLYYMPVLIPAVISGLLWKNFTSPEYGFANRMITAMGFKPYPFFTKASTSLPSLIFLNLFGLGGGMVLWLASLKGINKELYESADIEGASFFRKTFAITIPMCSPIIFYNLILNIIGGLQTFGGVFVLTGGGSGRDNALLFYVMNVYNKAFNPNTFNMGYASSLSWMLFLVIALLTLIIFKRSKWVFYGEDV